MITFFTILLGLVVVNALLLIFSVNKTKQEAKKTTSYILKNSVTNFEKETATLSSYKKAV